MKKLSNHPIYQIMEDPPVKWVLDFDVEVLQPDGPYEGEATHKQAVLEAFSIRNEWLRQYRAKEQLPPFQFTVEPEKMEATLSTWEELTWVPEDFPWNEEEKLAYKEKNGGIWGFGWPVMSLGCVFLDPPYHGFALGEDFDQLCQILFPNRDALEIFRWNDTWSDYFDRGILGTCCWSVYDRKENLFVVIYAAQFD